MATDRLQLQRLELKYLVSAETALAIRDFVRAYLSIDEFGADKPNYSYAIHSVYLDSDDLRTYWDTINGNKNRYKLRIRYYDDRPESPVFFELKRRMNDAILKQRGAVRRSAVPELLAGRLPAMEDLLSPNAKQLVALQNFCRLLLDIQAKPQGQVSYLREAWVSTHDNSVRVTLDRDVKYEPRHNSSDLTCRMENPVRPFEPHVILELKFTGRYPDWFRELVQVFNLVRVGAAKYADGVLEAGMEQYSFGQRVNGSDLLSPAGLHRRQQQRLAGAVF